MKEWISNGVKDKKEENELLLSSKDIAETPLKEKKNLTGSNLKTL